MIIIGVDFHPEFQQIAYLDSDTGELTEKRLGHREEAEQFYRALVGAGLPVRVGMEASGHGRWFERLLGELQIELWIGDAAEIRTKRVRKQKTDRQDAQLILKLMLKDDFPRIWVPSWENRDLRQLLWHRHRMVQARTRIMNQLQAVALNEGLRCKKRLWRTKRPQLESFQLAPWTSRRRHDLLELLDRLNPTIAELSQAVEQEVEKFPEAQRLATHPASAGSLSVLDDAPGMGLSAVDRVRFARDFSPLTPQTFSAHVGIDSVFASEHTSLVMPHGRRLFACTCLFLCLAFPRNLRAQEEQGCEKLQSTAEKAQCLEQKLRASEANMKRAFEHALSAFLPHSEAEKDLPTLPKKDAQVIRDENRLTVRALRDSQTKWLWYRESACSAVEHIYEGATITAEAVPACKLELTQQRTAWLNSYFNDEHR